MECLLEMDASWKTGALSNHCSAFYICLCSDVNFYIALEVLSIGPSTRQTSDGYSVESRQVY